jgi:hypothetical protein
MLAVNARKVPEFQKMPQKIRIAVTLKRYRPKTAQNAEKAGSAGRTFRA